MTRFDLEINVRSKSELVAVAPPRGPGASRRGAASHTICTTDDGSITQDKLVY